MNLVFLINTWLINILIGIHLINTIDLFIAEGTDHYILDVGSKNKIQLT